MNAKGKLSFPSSSSSSWTKRRHFPLGRLVNNQDESSTTPQLEFMMDDSSRNNSMTTGVGDDDDDTAPAPALASAIDVVVADDGNDDQTEGHVHMVRPVIDASDPLGGGGSASSVGGSNSMVIEREHMFEKVVTPSDVGKLNRLVIPKQHAERYFPLDSSTNEKGLLLNFEDLNGKAWRFRYSYWNSSQSYVITKGWSRFVKEKKLDAGDIVSFQRGVGELFTDRLYIDWRRRPDAPELATLLPTIPVPHHFPYHRSLHQWNPLFLQPQGTVSSFPGPPRDQALMLHTNSTVVQSHPNKFHSTTSPYGYNSVLNPCSGSVIYFRSTAGAAQQQHVGMVQMQRRGGGSGVVDPLVLDSVPVVHGKAAAKRLRLFGVNMDCAIPESDECDLLSSSSTMALQQPPQLSSSSSSIQLRPYNGSPLQAFPSDFPNKVKSSTMSLDLDI